MLKFIRNYKLPYIIYNFFHKDKLKHNIPLYRKYGIKKNYYSPISSKDFAHLPQTERCIDEEKLSSTIFLKIYLMRIRKVPFIMMITGI